MRYRVSCQLRNTSFVPTLTKKKVFIGLRTGREGRKRVDLLIPHPQIFLILKSVLPMGYYLNE